jgi:hypothetical protein
VQLVGSDNQIVAQADGPPLNNDYPTRLWRLSCQFADVHTLQLPADVPPGRYYLLIGMYNAADPAYSRAAVTAKIGPPHPNNAIVLGWITVEDQ